MKRPAALRPLGALLIGIWISPAFAGAPYVTDDAAPTETGHWENYIFLESTRADDQRAAPVSGIELNYGVYANAQLTLSLPFNPNPGAVGFGVVWSPLGAGFKYRFIQEDSDGWLPQVSFAPSIAIPVGHESAGASATGIFPILMQKSFGEWTVFGGGGYTSNSGRGGLDFANYGVGLQRHVTSDLALGAELFGEDKGSVDGRASAAIGVAALYDLSAFWHIVGSANTGIRNARESDQFSFNLAFKWTT